MGDYDRRAKNSILHVCGGDPIDTFFGSWLQVYSPRMWR